MTDRRAFISGIGSGLLASPFTALAQQPAKVYRIGVLANTEGPTWDGLRRGLRDLGYVEGRNLAMEWRWAEGRAERFADFAIELAQSKVDLIVTSSNQAALAAKKATSSIPIVMALGANQVKLGLVESLARPGGNITGLSNIAPDLLGKRLELLKEIAPKVARVAVLLNPANPIEPLVFREILTAAAVVGVEVQSIEVLTPDDYPAAFAAVTSSRANALFVYANPVNYKHRQLITDFALTNRLPGVYEERIFIEAGGLLSYAPSFPDMGRRAATYIDKILRGAKPGELPIEQPTKFELVINAKTAKSLGLTIPKSLLLRADEVIE
jgi:putative ABC transport system substrate-binding protein